MTLLHAGGCRPQVHVTTSGHEPAHVSAQAARTGAQLVVAVGGDGHASAVAGGLLGSEAALGLLPAGSANNYARTLGLDPADIGGAVRALLEPRLTRLDVVRVESNGEARHFLNVGGAGFDSVVAATAERIPVLRGAGRYVLAVTRELPRYRPAEFRIRLDGVGELSAPRFMLAFPRVFRGTHTSHPAVTMLTGRHLELDAERSFELTGDGERIGRLPARFTLLSSALPVAVGPGRP